MCSGHVGVCAGAVLATRKAPTPSSLLQDVKCINDNDWQSSGLTGTVRLAAPSWPLSWPPPQQQPMARTRARLAARFGPEPATSRSYCNGPLLAIDTPKPRREKLTRRECELAEQGGGALAGRSRRTRCRSSRTTYHRGEMDGAVAALASRYQGQAGRVILTLIDPPRV